MIVHRHIHIQTVTQKPVGMAQIIKRTRKIRIVLRNKINHRRRRSFLHPRIAHRIVPRVYPGSKYRFPFSIEWNPTGIKFQFIHVERLVKIFLQPLKLSSSLGRRIIADLRKLITVQQ